ncbi:MAG TPA: type II toxin-antitoxin system VapC family toxin [Xanthobacteraceae bacterium]|nr:type II toxin-antitoxin system VapC family toxin [Xanthobacteraceae bacterium]
MAFVIDASVAACWFFPDETDPIASQAWLRVHDDTAIVPAHWWFEIRNTMLIGERRARLTEQQITFAMERLARMAIRHDPIPYDADVFALARKHRLTFYDAAYLELAQREGLALATLDDKLVAAARSEQIALVGPAPEST